MELAFEKCDHIFLVLADLITLQQFSVLIIAIALYCVDSDLFSFPLLLMSRRHRILVLP